MSLNRVDRRRLRFNQVSDFLQSGMSSNAWLEEHPGLSRHTLFSWIKRFEEEGLVRREHAQVVRTISDEWVDLCCGESLQTTLQSLDAEGISEELVLDSEVCGQAPITIQYKGFTATIPSGSNLSDVCCVVEALGCL